MNSIIYGGQTSGEPSFSTSQNIVEPIVSLHSTNKTITESKKIVFNRESGKSEVVTTKTAPALDSLPASVPVTKIAEQPKVASAKQEDRSWSAPVISLSSNDASLRTELRAYVEELLAIEFRRVHPTSGTAGEAQFLKWYPGDTSARWGTGGGTIDTSDGILYQVYQITDASTSPKEAGFDWVRATA